MNKKGKTVTAFVAFALFIGLAVFAYNRLGKDFSPQNRLDGIQEKDESSQPDPELSQAPRESPQITQGPVVSQEPSQAPQEEEEEKTEAPDFTVEDGDGNSVKLSDFFGKPIVLNFWASWCSPCKKEMPEFDQVYAQVGEDITFMMVDLVDGKRETKTQGAQYVRQEGFSFPVYFDMEQEAAYGYGISSIPTTFFIDKDGYIVTGARGMLDGETLQKGIDLIK